MNFDRPPHEEDVVIEKELPIVDQEQIEDQVVVDERYAKEILPLIKIFKPEGVSLEEYESQFLDELYEDTKKIQVAKGILLASPDEEISSMKELLLSRFQSETFKVQGHLNNDEQVNKAAAALIVSGNFDENWTKNQQGFRNHQAEIGKYVRSLMKEYIEKEDFDAVKELLGNIDTVGKKVDSSMYWYFTPRLLNGELNFGQDTQRAILTGNMPFWVFTRYSEAAEGDELFNKLVPEKYHKLELINSYVKENYKFTNPFDQNIDKESFDRFKQIDALQGEDLETYISLMDQESSDWFTEAIVESKKNNFRNLSTQEKKNIFRFFNKNDYEDLLNNDIPLNLIQPSALPKNIDSESKDFLVEKWREVINTDPNPNRFATELKTILTFFSEDEITDLFEKSIISEVKVAPYEYLVGLKEKVLTIFDGYKKLSPSQQKILLDKARIEKFGEYANTANFNTQKVDTVISKLLSVPQESIETYLEEEITLELNKDVIFLNIKERDKMLDLYSKHVDYENDSYADVKKSKLESIKKSLLLRDHNESFPVGFLEKKEEFKAKYGVKGESLVALAITAYGIENPELFSKKMEAIEKILDKYNPENVPEGSNVSMGIEYEVTKSLAETYDQESILGYKTDALLISEAANIGKGNDAVHEFALKPTYNPYMLLAEVKLMQDAGLLDLNFEKYSNAARGYHLSLVGDSGLSADKNIQFLNNILTMTQLSGALAGNEVRSTQQIYTKGFDIFSNHAQKGKRCEFKGMACDTIEQFEKAIITAHHAGIAIQLSNKYVPSIETGGSIGSSSEEFERSMEMIGALAVPFESDQERDIVYEWIKLKNGAINAVEIHNESFIDSEFNGFLIDGEGNYIDTGEHIDVMRNKNLINIESLKTDHYKELLHINPRDLFSVSSQSFINTLIRTNNIFLKPPQGKENSAINARAMLDVVKEEGYGDIQNGSPTESIFDRGGEFRDGYYVVQGASEEMITHKSQIVLNHFNKAMEQLLQKPGVRREITEGNLVTA